MRTRRANFTDWQRAGIFARDRATCAFSGTSLWTLDHGVSPWCPMDWADHVVPCALGGTATLDNGVCATDTHNVRKSASRVDSRYLFRDGRVTPLYVLLHGAPDGRLKADLERRSALEPSDWFANRVIYNTFIGLDWRCDVELENKRPKRDDEYWFASARKRLAIHRRHRPSLSIEARCLLPSERAHGTDVLLQLESVGTDAQFTEWVETLWPLYRATRAVVHRVRVARDIADQRDLVDRASTDPRVNPALVAGLTELCDRDHERLELPLRAI